MCIHHGSSCLPTHPPTCTSAERSANAPPSAPRRSREAFLLGLFSSRTASWWACRSGNKHQQRQVRQGRIKDSMLEGTSKVAGWCKSELCDSHIGKVSA